jgi:hypothetical protein
MSETHNDQDTTNPVLTYASRRDLNISAARLAAGRWLGGLALYCVIVSVVVDAWILIDAWVNREPGDWINPFPLFICLLSSIPIAWGITYLFCARSIRHGSATAVFVTLILVAVHVILAISTCIAGLFVKHEARASVFLTIGVPCILAAALGIRVMYRLRSALRDRNAK